MFLYYYCMHATTTFYITMNSNYNQMRDCNEGWLQFIKMKWKELICWIDNHAA